MLLMAGTYALVTCNIFTMIVKIKDEEARSEVYDSSSHLLFFFLLLIFIWDFFLECRILSFNYLECHMVSFSYSKWHFHCFRTILLLLVVNPRVHETCTSCTLVHLVHVYISNCARTRIVDDIHISKCMSI